MEHDIAEIIQHWKQQRIRLNPGTSTALIARTAAALNCRFPASFEALYQQINGFADWDWLPNMFSIWPLEKMREEYNNEHTPHFIGFCDYLINSHQIGFLTTQPGIFKCYGDNKYLPVAENFIEAVKLINEDADRIY